jgi:hypothetical protein
MYSVMDVMDVILDNLHGEEPFAVFLPFKEVESRINKADDPENAIISCVDDRRFKITVEEIDPVIVIEGEATECR